MNSAWHQNYYKTHREKKLTYQKARIVERRKLVWSLKSKPCTDCKVQYSPWVMQFDHLPGNLKRFEISKQMFSANEAKLRREIAKCEVVCANCHAERSYKRINSLSGIKQI